MRREDLGGRTNQVSQNTRVLDGLAVGVIVHDATLRIVYTNSAAARLLGVSVQDALNRDVTDPRWVVCHPDGTPALPPEFPASVALRTREPVRGMILGVMRPEGGKTWVAVDGIPLYDAVGGVEFVVVTLSDVTRELAARTQLEEVSDSLGQRIRERDAALANAVQALDTSEARYQAVLRAMSEGVVVHGADGSILFANPAAQHVLGLTIEQLQGKRPLDSAWRLTDGSGQSLTPNLIPSEITRVTGLPQRHVLVGVHRGSSGGHAWLLVSTDPVGSPKDDQAEECPVVTTFTDVTAERNALSDARAARDNLRDIAAALPGVVIEHLLHSDGKFEVRYISEPAREYLGVTPADVLRDGTKLWSHVSPEDRDSLLAQLRDATAFSGLQLEFRLTLPNGVLRHLRFRSGPPTQVAAGLLFRSVVLDVTEQRRLEETVREAQRREAIGTLAAGMAHNFNNMLAVIVPSIELAQAQASPVIARELEDAVTATRAATELVRQLLQLVRREAADTAVAVDVSQLVEEVSQLCRRTFDSSIEIHCLLAPSPCVVLARRNELQQALVNLCINARDALHGRPRPQLTIRVTAENDQVVIELTDNGEGMSYDVQRRLGEPFFTTKEPGRGTGLGLATAYGIVADLRGVLKCCSTPGRGTCFEVRLPRHLSSSNQDSLSQQLEPSVPGVKVLLVDDEDLVRSTLKRVLVRANASVLSASRAVEGLELLHANPDVKLVLLDVAMPDVSGIEMLRRIRLFNATVPVYLMTGYLPEGVDVSRANGVLLKPVALSKLRELLVQFA